MVDDSSIQRISRLRPLDAILALIESRVGLVRAQSSPLEAACGFTLAENVVASAQPSCPTALRDGFAVEAAAVADANAYAPVRLPSAACRVDVGEPLPRGTDAVLALESVVSNSGRVEAVAGVTAGEGVLPANGDIAALAPLRRAGERLRSIDIAVMRAAGIKAVTVRAPRIGIVRGAGADSPILDAARTALNHAVTAAGGIVFGKAEDLVESLAHEQADAVIGIGGTGSGKADAAVHTLAQYGRVEAHGIAVAPGETATFGFVAKRPVLLVPGRLDAALAVWLLIGRHLLVRLAGGALKDYSATLPLDRKITSTIGLTELFPVTCAGGMARPLAAGYLSFTTLTQSDGWILVPAASEGFPAGTPVAVQPWP